MTVASLTAERELLETVLTGFATCPIAWPHTSFEPPAPTDDLASPQAYIVVDVQHERSAMSDMAGGERIDGRVLIDIWVEMRAGDRKVREIADELRTIFSTADVPGYQFLAPLMTPLAVKGPAWCGRGLAIPIVWFR